MNNKQLIFSYFLRVKRLLYLIYKFLIRSKKIYRKPNKSDVIIFDREGSENFIQYFNNKNIHIMDTNGESLNVIVLFLSFFIFGFRFNLSSYIGAYIKIVSPKLIITFIDNRSAFYRIKTTNPDVVTVLIQNGKRTFDVNFCSDIPIDSYVDYMLVFGDGVAKDYSSFIHGTVIPIGSFKLNYISKKITLKPESLCENKLFFISDYRPGSREYSDDIFMAEKELLPKLYSFCTQEGLELNIIGSSFLGQSHEIDFYSTIFKNKSGWRLLLRENTFSSYLNILNAKYVVSIDSTLGLEALALGKRTAYFNIRNKYCNNYPESALGSRSSPKKGEFWTNELDQSEFRRVLETLYMTSDEEWLKIANKYNNYTMYYDPGNTIFIRLLKKLGVDLKEDL